MSPATHKKLDELIAFHGHLCPGLAIGYRATSAALERLGVDRAQNEELVAIVENDSCSVDAVQFLAGATFGKGNFFFRDWGKQVFTFSLRGKSPAIRIALKRGALDAKPEQQAMAKKINSGGETEEERQDRVRWRQEKIDYILNAPVDELFEIIEVEIEPPPEARIFNSVICDSCGEPVMETRTLSVDGKTLCTECGQAR